MAEEMDGSGGFVSSILEDRRAGLQTDATGRRFFRQRNVRFKTIRIDVEEIHSSALPGMEEDLPGLNWNKELSHEQIRNFALDASERFLVFWYRVFDVAVARGLSGKDRQIFREEVFERSMYADIGLPEQLAWSSVPPELHRKITEEYRLNRNRSTTHRIYYLSDYLHGLNSDLIESLSVYGHYWDMIDTRRQLQKRPASIYDEMVSALKHSWPGGDLLQRLHSIIDLFLQKAIEQDLKDDLTGIQDERVRSFLLSRKRDPTYPLRNDLKQNILKYNTLPGLSPLARILQAALDYPDHLHRNARRAMMNETMLHRLRLRKVHLNRLRAKNESPSLEEEGASHMDQRMQMLEKNFQKFTVELENQQRSQLFVLLLNYGRYLQSRGTAGQNNITSEEIAYLQQSLDPSSDLDRPHRDDTHTQSMQEAVEQLRQADLAISDYHEKYTEQDLIEKRESERRKKEMREQAEANPEEQAQAVSQPSVSLDTIPPEEVNGDPMAEPQIVERARQILFSRLRPIRMTANRYSTVSGHRHGAIPLNPVMKLWKSKPAYYEKDLPPVTTFELNTTTAMDTLIQLGKLADPHLATRGLQWRGIMKQKKGEQHLGNARFFLLPGSAFPVREVHRLDYPEFRGTVIGESRNPVELGVDRQEDSILSGGWYNKSNHSLYYTVGGDNGSLLRTIWRAGRFQGPPAFFFALGQFVHDTIEDNRMYYKSGQITFREMVESYYREEDRIRKNRGERTGRRKADNTRDGIRFMFGVFYARLVMEILTGSPQIQIRSRGIEKWMVENLELPVIHLSDRSELRSIRKRAIEIIESAPAVAVDSA